MSKEKQSQATNARKALPLLSPATILGMVFRSNPNLPKQVSSGAKISWASQCAETLARARGSPPPLNRGDLQLLLVVVTPGRTLESQSATVSFAPSNTSPLAPLAPLAPGHHRIAEGTVIEDKVEVAGHYFKVSEALCASSKETRGQRHLSLAQD